MHIYMKKIISFILLLGVLCLAGCSSGKEESEEIFNEVEKPSEDEKPSQEEIEAELFKKQVQALKDSLCFNGKFVERQFKELSAHSNNLKAVVKQKDYTFTSDGKGKLKTYTLTNSGLEDYTESEADIEWSVSNTPPLSLKIKTGEIESFSLEEVKVDNGVLSFKNGDWPKELIVSDTLSSDDVISYSVEHLYGWTENRGEDVIINITPTILTVKTKNGVMRFIRGRFSYNTIGFPQGKWEEREGSYVKDSGFFEQDIYFSVAPSTSIFYDVYRTEKSLDFRTENSSGYLEYNFKVGHITEDHTLTMFDNNKDYQLGN